ncbi:MAG: polysaccharide deacetylase family protein [Gloeobacteraceae cyanobacterium ES-bin-316]|nr:polysaccharide deacetylase family protein [Ferruginibacter sp.]
MFYFVKTPSWIQKVFRTRIWEIKTTDQAIFLSFDDGPHPEHTNFVLDELKKHSAKATFFCVGKNVVAHPETYRRIIEEGHSVGNHTFDHLNGSKTDDKIYLDNIAMAKKYIYSKLFRPPYGRLSNFLAKHLLSPGYKLNTIMWTVLSGDFDASVSNEQCLQNVLLNTRAGSIVVFHDSDKASSRLAYALPRVLEYFSEKGFEFKPIKL